MQPLRRIPLLGRLTVGLLLAAGQLAMAYNLDPDSPESVKSISKQMAEDLVAFYHGNEPGGTPGLLPDPYYWWEAGAMLGTLIDYWYYTGDDTYNNLTQQALLFQVGETNDYMPRNQTRTEGNDDQGFWGLSVMSAAEFNFPNPPLDRPQWLALAQAVFNTQAARWDTEYCNGGLRWQIFTWNNGYDYKNSISQACFFALGARLALYTGNQTYADWAEKTWNWMIDVKFINTSNWYVYDGADVETNCTVLTPYQFTYNAGGMILGAAAMYNYTESKTWKDRLDNLVTGSKVFFTGPKNDIMTEVACEPVSTCNVDEHSFKAYLSRWLASITKWAPHTNDVVMPLLRASSIAAAKQCVGGDNGRMCGLVWNEDKYDGTSGVGQQMAALEVTMANLVGNSSAPVTAHSGGTSQGDPGSGGDDIGRNQPKGPEYEPLDGGDRFGAAILTLLLLGSMVGTMFFLFLDEASGKGPLVQFKGFHSSASAAIATLAAGGGMAAAAAAGRRRGEKEKGVGINEKSVATSGDSGSNGSLRGSSSNNNSAEAAPAALEPVRHGGVSRRRVSNMPIGWPHNPSVRNSVVVAESSSAGASAEEQRQQ
ncbi:glycoside hydrolase family 76 protein [Trichoderma cornu-damae]|uniref:mannan endo-1,6-alpha-mannosidase n=1 Tax=Trichoderma cornu-damae TaxID=654480 RepID=A0A9P8QHC4_9HYPO|nr:glycoside hydrolase family 76 protein [Trichoderma cornu-damae]